MRINSAVVVSQDIRLFCDRCASYFAAMTNEFGEDFRPEFIPTPFVKSPWTVQDFDACVELVVKARHHHVFENVMNRVHRIENGTQTHFAACGLSDGDYAGCVEMTGGGVGAMSDASKRLRSDDDGKPSVYEDGYVVAELPTPMPTKHHLIPDTAVLPPGVPSLADWGDYKVAFGKYKHLKTYRDVNQEMSEDMKNYRRYLFSHYNSGSSLLKDLVNYLKAMGRTPGDDPLMGPVIPGTSIARTK